MVSLLESGIFPMQVQCDRLLRMIVYIGNVVFSRLFYVVGTTPCQDLVYIAVRFQLVLATQ